MRIVSLAPFLTEIVVSLGKLDSLIGISHLCDHPADIAGIPIVTSAAGGESGLAPWGVKMAELMALKPDVVLTSVNCSAEEEVSFIQRIRSRFSEWGYTGRVEVLSPRSVATVHNTFSIIGSALKEASKARELANRLRAQLMDWADNFYDRMKNKKVAFLSSTEPFQLAGFWIPELIQLCSAKSMEPPRGEIGRIVKWQEIVDFRPDVIIIAPDGSTIEESMGLFFTLEKLPGWEQMPAVKRGEVIFTSGKRLFYRPSSALMPSMAILVSAIAGMESGYISERDSFYRLRWLELQRHRIQVPKKIT